MSKRRIRWDFWSITTVIILLAFTVFLIYPLLSLFLSGFQDPESGRWTLENYKRFFFQILLLQRTV